MALIKCGECASEVSDKAMACPKCGAPIVAAKVTVVLSGIPRRVLGAKAVEIFYNGQHVGSVAKGATEKFVFDCGGTLDFVHKSIATLGEKRVTINVDDGALLELVAEVGSAGGFTVAPPRESPTYFVGFSRDLDF